MLVNHSIKFKLVFELRIHFIYSTLKNNLSNWHFKSSFNSNSFKLNCQQNNSICQIINLNLYKYPQI